MSAFAASVLDLGGIIAWLVVGVIAGCLAGRVTRCAGYGIIGDMAIGLLGAVVGGFLFGQFSKGEEGFWGSVVIAFVGACLLLLIARVVAFNRTRL